MDKSIDQIYQEALDALKEATSYQAVEDISVRYLGRKGRLTAFLRNIASLPPEQRAEAGKKANIAKKKLEAAIKDHGESLKAGVEKREEGIDVSLPGRPLTPARR